MANPRTRAAIKHRLILGVYGSPGEWWQAALEAERHRWTDREIRSVLFWYHPMTWVWAAAICLVLGSIGWGIYGH